MQLLPPPRIPPYLVRIGNRVGHGADDSESVSPNRYRLERRPGHAGDAISGDSTAGSVSVSEIRQFSKLLSQSDDDQHGDLFLRSTFLTAQPQSED